MILAISLAFSMVVITFVFHYRVMLLLSVYTQKLSLEKQTQVLLVVLVLFLAHIAEISIYGLVYHMSVTLLHLGVFEGAAVESVMSYLYYSGVVYTTLGLGDVQPLGHIRFITAIEALNGLVLITWSASFTFLVMGRLWPWPNQCSEQEVKHIND